MAPFLREKITEAGPLLPMLPGAGIAGVDTRSQPVLPTSLGSALTLLLGRQGGKKGHPEPQQCYP